MAHELTIRQNGFAEMAFVGQTPWHGLGQELQEGADMETWRKAAGMDWTLESSPVVYAMPDGILPDLNTFAGQNVLYRSDTKAPMSIVSDRYKPVQPTEVLDFFKDLVEESGFKLHTAGTLFGGKRLWALAETGKFGEIVKNDGIGSFLLLSTSCDRSLSTTARFTSVRVVCNNTLSMATASGMNSVSFTHATKFDHDFMKLKLGASVEAFDAFMLMGKHLQKQQMNVNAATQFVTNLLQIEETEHSVKDTKGFHRIMDLFEGDAKGSELVGHTKWAMLNAVTEYFDHHIPTRTADARLNNSWFGNGNIAKNKAVQLLVAV